MVRFSAPVPLPGDHPQSIRDHSSWILPGPAGGNPEQQNNRTRAETARDVITILGITARTYGLHAGQPTSFAPSRDLSEPGCRCYPVFSLHSTGDPAPLSPDPPSCVSPCALPAMSLFVHRSTGPLRELLHRPLWDCYEPFVFGRLSSPGTAAVQTGGEEDAKPAFWLRLVPGHTL